tara:strand:+ start:2308 stop:3786 length:1479 start_codon:yes stop_codon:yes gene_type:complete
MLKYTIQRLITFIPMLIAISLIAFIISINAPGDPVERLSKSAGNEGGAEQESGASKKEKQEIRKRLGLDLPIFYINIGSIASSDTLYKIQDKYHKKNLKALTHQSGNWRNVSNYYKNLLSFYDEIKIIKANKIISDNPNLSLNDINESINILSIETNSLLEKSDKKTIEIKINQIKQIISEKYYLTHLTSSFSILESNYNKIFTQSTKWKNYIPSIKWYGANNQYHLWLLGNGKDRNGIIRGDFGISYMDGQQISTKIWDKVWISFALALISIIIAYVVSIPIGIYSAYKNNSATDKGISLVLFILYSMPTFFVGVLLLLAFANPDNLSWFPVAGIQDASTFDPEWSNFKKIQHRLPYLVLPIITYTYGSFAFLSRIMRIGMIDIVSQDYIRTARAKGLGEKKVILKHALRNSLLPIITVFAAIFPSAVGGSVIIEIIFSIPGMGTEIYAAILNYDYPMIITFFTLVGFLTMIGYLVSDLLYALVDPRISYK